MFSFGGKPRPPTLNTNTSGTATAGEDTVASATASERPLSFASTRTTASSFRNSIFSALTSSNTSSSVHGNGHSSFAASTAPPSLYSLGSRGSSSGSETSSLHAGRTAYHPTSDDPIFLHKARLARARAVRAQQTRLVQAQFVAEVLAFLGYGAVLGGSCATVLHGVDVVLGRGMEHNAPEKRVKRHSRNLSGGGHSLLGGGPGDELGAMAALAAEDVTVPADVDVVVQLPPAAAAESAGRTLWEVTDTAAREIVARFPQWFYIEYSQPASQQQQNEEAVAVDGEGAPENPPEGPPQARLFFHDPDNLLTTNLNLFSMMAGGGGASAYSFSDMIEFAAQHPPPPPAAVAEPELPPTPTTPRPRSSSSSSYGGGGGEEPSLRSPVHVKLHIAGPRAAWSWLTHLTLLPAGPAAEPVPSVHRTTVTHPAPIFSAHDHGSGAGPGAGSGSAAHGSIPLSIPLLALPTLLVAKLCSANHRLRSIVMSDKKKGHLDLRQSVAISRHMRMLGVRLPREWMPPPPEAIRVLVRLRGSKGKEERELLLWVLRVGSGSSAEAKQQSSFQGGANGATYVSGMNRQLRELALVRRSTTHEFSSGVGSPISGPRSPRTVSLHGSGYFPPSTPRVEEPERVFFPEPTPATPQPVAVEPIEKEQVQVQQKEQYTHANTHQVIPVLAQESNGVVKVDMEALMAAEEAAAQPPPPPVAPAMEKISRSASVRWSFKGWGAGKA